VGGSPSATDRQFLNRVPAGPSPGRQTLLNVDHQPPDPSQVNATTRTRTRTRSAAGPAIMTPARDGRSVDRATHVRHGMEIDGEPGSTRVNGDRPKSPTDSPPDPGISTCPGWWARLGSNQRSPLVRLSRRCPQRAPTSTERPGRLSCWYALVCRRPRRLMSAVDVRPLAHCAHAGGQSG
jgi:hypothetical protein